MTYTSSTRDRYRLAVWATTTAVSAGALTATGWVAGAAAEAQSREDAARAAEQDALAQAEYAAWAATYGTSSKTRQHRRTVLRQRPTRTRVTTRYVTATSPVAAVGAGGTVSTPSGPNAQTQPTGSSGDGGSSSSSGSSDNAGSSQTPPPPPPPPTPTSGS